MRRSRRRVSWRDRFPDEVTCVRCLEVVPTDDTDRLLWCADCRDTAHARARRWGWLVGAVVAVTLALWIYFGVQPSRELILGGWVGVVIGGFWVGARFTREIAYGAQRYFNRRAVEAVPPAPEGEGGEERGEGTAEDA